MAENRESDLVNIEDRQGNTPLHLAVKCPWNTLVDTKEQYSNATEEYIMSQCKDLFHIILELCKSANKTIQNRYEHYPSHDIVCHMHEYWENPAMLEMAEAVLCKENLAHAKVFPGYSALHFAVGYEKWNFVRLLVKKGIDRNCLSYGCTALIHVVQRSTSIPMDVF